jgi:hypothetical protein
VEFTDNPGNLWVHLQQKINQSINKTMQKQGPKMNDLLSILIVLKSGSGNNGNQL